MNDEKEVQILVLLNASLLEDSITTNVIRVFRRYLYKITLHLCT